MLAKKNKISSTNFASILRGSKRVSWKSEKTNISLSFSCKKENTISKFAVVVSKKTCKLAVKRNRLKRIVYSFLEKNLSKLKPTCSGIITIHKYGKEEGVLLSAIESLLQKAGLFS